MRRKPRFHLADENKGLTVLLFICHNIYDMNGYDEPLIQSREAGKEYG